MSVLIRGMEMPTSCGDCKAFVCYRKWAGDAGDCFCALTQSDANEKTKNADCPLIPIPPHGPLIDAEAPLRFEVAIDAKMHHTTVDIYAPTVIEAEECDT